MNTPGAILDIAALALLIICTLYYARKGFVNGILSLVGSLLVIVGAYFVAKNAAPSIFDNMIRPGLEERVTDALVQTLGQQTTLTADMLEQALESVASFLPDYAISAVVNAFEYSSTPDVAGFAAGMVTDLIAPMVTPVIVVLLFVLVFLVLRILLGLIIFVVDRIARLPVVGTVNSALGAVMGVFVAGVYIFLIVAVLQGAYAAAEKLSDAANPFTTSIFYLLFSGLNLIKF